MADQPGPDRSPSATLQLVPSEERIEDQLDAITAGVTEATEAEQLAAETRIVARIIQWIAARPSPRGLVAAIVEATADPPQPSVPTGAARCPGQEPPPPGAPEDAVDASD
jgi:hypothetical protein